MGSELDDRNIDDDAQLWRRISPEWLVDDQNLGTKRPSSQAFQNLADGKMSVLLADEVRRSGRTAEDVLRGFSRYALASLSAGFVRQHGQSVVWAPEPDEPAHCHVVGEKSKSVRKAFVREAEWVTPPSAQPLEAPP